MGNVLRLCCPYFPLYCLGREVCHGSADALWPFSEGLEWVRAAPSAEELRERAEQQRPELVELFRTMRHSGQRSQRRGRGRRRSLAAR